VSAFYRGSQGCQPSISVKPVPVQALRCKKARSIGLERRQGKACGSIMSALSIEKINLRYFSYKGKRRFRVLVLYTGVSEILPA
jgi:hypothetical protein